jgi:uncharacterized Fe-S cluster-containing radical SAM superfamily protein
MDFPFDPIERSQEVENLVTKDTKRSYYRFRSAPYYGGIATADAVGCSFLCAYCWNYNRNLHPERFREFYSPQQVASKLLSIADKKSYRLFRISGAEPLLGERTFLHLVEVLRLIFQNKTDSLFILETNGFFLGHRLDLLKNLKPYPNLGIRICLKGTDEDSFEKITGAKKEFFRYPIMALKELLRLEVRAWPALMGDLFSPEDIDRLGETLKEEDIHVELELEFLESYPFVLDNMRKRKIRF